MTSEPENPILFSLKELGSGKKERILDLLPGSDCGLCGQEQGCAGFAAALASGSAKPKSCPFLGEVFQRDLDRVFMDDIVADEGQEIAGKNFYRPQSAKVAEKYAKQFSPVKLFTIDEVFGGWGKAQKTHFDDGGTFDQIYQPASKS